MSEPDSWSSDAVVGRLTYLVEHLASLHASPDIPWLTGRFEFLGENAVGATLTVLAFPDATEAYRAELSGAPRTTNARLLWDELGVGDLPRNAEAARIFGEVAATGRPRTLALVEMFPGAESALVNRVIVAPIIHNQEVLGAALFVLAQASDDAEATAALLCSHAAVAIYQLREREESRRLHSTDPRLWVPDEDFLLAQFRREVIRARRYGREVGLALIRIENEQEIRGRFGSFYADHLLRRVGAQLLSVVRDSDVVGALDDAFAVIHAETGLQGTRISGERLRDRVIDMVRQRFPEAPEIEVTAGMVAYPESGSSVEDMLQELLGPEAAARYERPAA